MTATHNRSDAIERMRKPLDYALNSDRRERQSLIAQYQSAYSCSLIVMNDVIRGHSVTMLEEVLHDNDPGSNLHVILNSPGGDPDVAVRLVRSAQIRCRELTIIVPDQAKSAATLMAIGAHHILTGPAGDLGPIDMQFVTDDGLISAKDIIAAIDDAESRIQVAPDVFPIYASLLEDLSAIMVQQARSALARSHDLLTEALQSNSERSSSEIERLATALRGPLIDDPASHSALFSAHDARNAGLSARVLDPFKRTVEDGLGTMDQILHTWTARV